MSEEIRQSTGGLGVGALFLGGVALFLGGMAAVGFGFSAVVLGFIGTRRKHRFSQIGLIVGSFSLVFFNFVSMGIVKPASSDATGKEHLARSMQASIDAYNVLKAGELSEGDMARMVSYFEVALQESRQVNMAVIDSQVPGFREHYENEFIAGVRTTVAGYTQSDTIKKMQGGMLLDWWGTWANASKPLLEKVEEPPVSLFSFFRSLILS